MSGSGLDPYCAFPCGCGSPVRDGKRDPLIQNAVRRELDSLRGPDQKMLLCASIHKAQTWRVMSGDENSRLVAEAQRLREQAFRARRLARGLYSRDVVALERYAAELEQEARDLDRRVRDLDGEVAATSG